LHALFFLECASGVHKTLSTLLLDRDARRALFIHTLLLNILKGNASPLTHALRGTCLSSRLVCSRPRASPWVGLGLKVSHFYLAGDLFCPPISVKIDATEKVQRFRSEKCERVSGLFPCASKRVRQVSPKTPSLREALAPRRLWLREVSARRIAHLGRPRNSAHVRFVRSNRKTNSRIRFLVPQF
jgi:hypothetical protein